MKLRNKKTGEIGKILKQLSEDNQLDVITDNKLYVVKSLAELNAEWEDYEEEENIWWLDNEGRVNHVTHEVGNNFENNREIGNYFETKEEAEKAVEKLKAWKRLKDKGFRFKTWGWDDSSNNEYTIYFTLDSKSGDAIDLDLLFGGEE